MLLLLFLSVGVSAVSASTRTLNFKNSCGENVRIGFTAGAVPNSFCSSDSDCPSNSVCGTESKLCYYSSFMRNGYYDLNENSTASFTVSIEYGSLYSGAVFVSTGCDSYTNACETGICRNKACSLWAGAVGPHTRAEFTFDPKSVDFYDISLMHGVNVPMAMTAVGGNKVSGDAYSCGSAGSVVATDELPACSYGYSSVVNGVDYSADIEFVAPSNLNALQYCSSSADCAGNSGSGDIVCGLSAGRDPNGLPTTGVDKVCGHSVGVWSMDEVCVYSAGQYAATPYQCSSAVNYGTRSELFGCSGAYVYSGYQPTSPVEKTCGCHDWEGMPGTKCSVINPEWVSVALPWVEMVKNICHTAYSFAYDDMSSTFTCGGEVNYDIEFCPAGVTLHKL